MDSFWSAQALLTQEEGFPDLMWSAQALLAPEAELLESRQSGMDVPVCKASMGLRYR